MSSSQLLEILVEKDVVERILRLEIANSWVGYKKKKDE